MVINKGLIIILVSLVSGCAGLKIKDPDQVNLQESLVPILYCPSPPRVERPALPIETITNIDNKDPGIVAKKYKATIKALQGYSIQLEEALKSYDEASKAYEDLRKRFKQKVNAGEFDSVPEKTPSE